MTIGDLITELWFLGATYGPDTTVWVDAGTPFRDPDPEYYVEHGVVGL